MTSCGWKGPVLVVVCASLARALVKDVLNAEAEQDSRGWPPKRPPFDGLRRSRRAFLVRSHK